MSKYVFSSNLLILKYINKWKNPPIHQAIPSNNKLIKNVLRKFYHFCLTYVNLKLEIIVKT